jgi:hypothetical protein
MSRVSRTAVPAVDWVLLTKAFPSHSSHIFRVRNDREKLALLSQRLIKGRVVALRSLRDGKPLKNVKRLTASTKKG